MIKNWLMSMVVVLSAGFMFATITPQTVSAASSCNSNFLGFPAWYNGLTENGSCELKSPGDNISAYIWQIALNILGMAMMAAAYVSVFFIMYGGFQFFTSLGSSDGAAKARATILNAIIGLVISLVAVGIINFIVNGIL